MWTFGEGAGPGLRPGSKRFWKHKNSQKMHIVGINFISFTAQNNALHMLSKNGDFWAWRLWPPKFAYECT